MKIRGNLVGTTQKPEKVIVRATDLTEEQKAQARENIAAAEIDDSCVGTSVWSSKNIVDKLCPSFMETGAMVACEPVERYPLEVISEIPFEEKVVVVCRLVTYDPDTGEYTETSEIIDDPDPSANGADRYDDEWTTSGRPVYACDGTLYTRTEQTFYSFDGLTLTRYGKNLLGYESFSVNPTNRTLSYTNGVGKISITKAVSTDWIFTATDTNSYLKNKTLEPGTYVFSLKQLSGTTLKNAYARVFLKDGTTVKLTNGKAVTLTQKGTISGIKFDNTNFEKGEEFTFTLQIEVGSVATDYEPYREEKYTADFGGHNDNYIYGSYNWTTGVLIDADNDYQEVQFAPQPMLAYEGVNTFVSSTGDTTVKGKKDPVKVIEDLTNAIIASGGNV